MKNSNELFRQKVSVDLQTLLYFSNKTCYLVRSGDQNIYLIPANSNGRPKNAHGIANAWCEFEKKNFLFYSTHITVLICLLHCDFYCKIGNFGLCALWQLACKWMWQCRKSLSASHCLHEGRNCSQFMKWTSHDNTESHYKYPDHQIFKIVGLESKHEWNDGTLT